MSIFARMYCIGRIRKIWTAISCLQTTSNFGKVLLLDVFFSEIAYSAFRLSDFTHHCYWLFWKSVRRRCRVCDNHLCDRLCFSGCLLVLSGEMVFADHGFEIRTYNQ